MEKKKEGKKKAEQPKCRGAWWALKRKREWERGRERERTELARWGKIITD